MHIKSLLLACTLYMPLTLAAPGLTVPVTMGYAANVGLAKNGCDVCKPGYFFVPQNEFCDQTKTCCIGKCGPKDGGKT